MTVFLEDTDFAIDGLIFASRFAFLEGNVPLKCRATLDGKRRPFSRGSSHATFRTLHVLEREMPFLNRLPSFNFLKIRVASSWNRICPFLFRFDFGFVFAVDFDADFAVDSDVDSNVVFGVVFDSDSTAFSMSSSLPSSSPSIDFVSCADSDPFTLCFVVFEESVIR